MYSYSQLSETEIVEKSPPVEVPCKGGAKHKRILPYTKILDIWNWNCASVVHRKHGAALRPRRLRRVIDIGDGDGDEGASCCAVCMERLDWVAVGRCGHREECSKRPVHLIRFFQGSRQRCICRAECSTAVVARAGGEILALQPARQRTPTTSSSTRQFWRGNLCWLRSVGAGAL